MVNWNGLADVADLFARFGVSPQFCRQLVAAYPGMITSPTLYIGIGNGAAAQVLIEAGNLVIGIDSAAQISAIAAERGILTFNLDASNLPMPSSSFGGTIFIATGVLECVDDDKAFAILSELTRCASKIGRIMVNHFNHEANQRLYADLGFLDEGRLSTRLRYEYWQRLKSGLEADLRGARYVRIFDQLGERRIAGREQVSDYLPILPEHHYIRSPNRVTEWLCSLGWRNTVISGANAEANLFFIMMDRA